MNGDVKKSTSGVRSGLLVSVLVAGMTACAAPPTTDDYNVGRLDLPLTATSTNTTNHYRLVDATFEIAGLSGSEPPRIVSTQGANPDEAALRLPLPIGDYAVLLLNGWSMQRLDARTGRWVPVAATLANNRVLLSIALGQIRQVLFAFEVPEGPLGFGEGEIVIAVDENGECPAGYVDCGAGCVDLGANASHCGGCGTACGFPRGSATCDTGECELSACQPGFDDCDGDPSNGCEIDLSETFAHCGACGVHCPYLQACVDGACKGGTP